MSSTPQDQYLAVCKELERLNHDIARHVQITAEQAQEIERLRTEITEAEQERDRHFSARGRLVGERDQLRADLAAARALLLEARGWLDPWESRQSALRDRIDAALAGQRREGE